MNNSPPRATIKELPQLAQRQLPQSAYVKGWVRTKRGNKAVCFVAFNDDSTIHSIQIVTDKIQAGPKLIEQITINAAIGVVSTLVASQGQGQEYEVQASEITIYGTSNPVYYPLQRKGHTLEFLREIAHLHPRTNTFAAVLRVRHNMAYTIHTFSHERDYFYLHTPIITSDDTEGAGQMFIVTTLDMNKPPFAEDGSVDYSKDFFGKHTSLTISGRLEGELGAVALGGIYTFGPISRVENSNTPWRLAELWMVEPEVAFMDNEGNQDLTEALTKHCPQWASDHCMDDLEFLAEYYNKELIKRIRFVVEHSFVRTTYTEGVTILEEAVRSGKKFEFPVYWGANLASEHRRYLVEQHYNASVIMTDYPKEIKAFYMKQNENDKTVRGMNVLFPHVGEIIGGSERKTDIDKLTARTQEVGIEDKDLWWYLDTRRYGSVPHADFGLGFGKLLLFVAGTTSIRDIISFPRTPDNANF